MIKKTRNLMMSLTLIVALMFTSTQKCSAIIPVTDYAHIAVQITEFGEVLLRWRSKLKYLKNEFKAYKMMLQNIKKLPKTQWKEFKSSLKDMKKALKFQNNVSYTASEWETNFKSTFKGFDSYYKKAMGGKKLIDFQKEYKMIQKQTNDTVHSVLKSLGVQDENMKTDEDTLKELENLSQGSKGQLQAIQAANTIATQQIHSLKRLQKTMMAQVQLQAQYIAAQNEEKIILSAASKAFKDKRETVNHSDDKPMP